MDVVSQIALTLVIFTFTVFLLGFIADPIISFCLDPTGSFLRMFGMSYDPIILDDDGTWVGHFTKGFASLGLASFFKVLAASPIQFWYRGGATGRRAGNRRDQLSNTTWLLIMIGAVTFVVAIWKGVRRWSLTVLNKASDRVVDVQEDEGDDDDEE
jgi:hypothetical protein